jgi:hypothetical protein
VLGSVIIREIIKANAGFFTLFLHLGSLMEQLTKKDELIKAAQNN